MKLRCGLIAAALISAAAGSASAAPNVVTNGGFETGDFTGFTQGGNTGDTGVASATAASGNYGAFFGPGGSDGTLSQTLDTTVGDEYTLSYAHSYEGGSPSDFSVDFGGTIFDATVDATGPTDYTTYVDKIVATSASTLLQFTFRQDPGVQKLDDIVVTDTGAGAVSAAPEPSIWVLMLAGVGMLGALLRMQQDRRRDDTVNGIGIA